MKQNEFLNGLNEKIRNVARNVELCHEGEVCIVFPQVRGGWENYAAGRFTVSVPTKSALTKASLMVVNSLVDEILEKARINHEADQAWMRTPEGIERANRDAEAKMVKARTARAISLAESTMVLVDEHGSSYGRGDHFSVNVHDVVEDPITLRKFHASGKMLALVSQERKRVYAKSYHYGPSVREDYFLIGENENGVAFAHPISNVIRNYLHKTVESALKWVWDIENLDDLIDRHGDVAVLKSNKQFKTPGKNGEIAVLDSHVFTGEYRKNGSLYVRNGVLHHKKGQHPDVNVGNEWVKLKPANRSERRVATGSRD